MDHHTAALQQLCRICGFKTSSRRSKLTLKDEILFTTSIDILNDDPNVHPAYVCGGDAAKLYRSRTDNFITIQTVTFHPHSDTCVTCKSFLSESSDNQSRKRLRSNDNANSRSLGDPTELENALMSLSKKDRLQCLKTVFTRLPFDEKCDLMYEFGSAIGPIIKQGLNSQNGGEHLDPGKLTEFSLTKYASEQFPLLTQFFCGLCGNDLDHVPGDELRCHQMATACEVIYKMIDASYTGTLSFLHSLNIYGITKSKLAVNLSAGALAGGKYSTITRWLDNQGHTSMPCPSGDIVVMFDNNQIVGKTWSIKPNNKVQLSIVTNVGAVALTNSNGLEARKDIHPRKWLNIMNNEGVVDSMLDSDNPELSLLEEIHNNQLKCYVTAAIEILCDENVHGEDEFDSIVANRENSRNFNLCSNESCAKSVPKPKRKCPECGCNVTSKPMQSTSKSADAPTPEIKIIPMQPDNGGPDNRDEDRYLNVKSYHSGKTHTITLFDPVFVNPNSFDNVIAVLRDIGKTTGVTRYGGTDRSWVPVCCDGLPFTMMIKIVQEYLQCQICRNGFMGTLAFLQHATQDHPSTDPNTVAFIR